jgi:predicted transcriptional regulator of viral defense system
MSDARSKQAWELAGRQYGIVARRQLLALGFSSRSIEHRCKTGRLHVVARGVYAIGWPALDQHRRWMAAVLACGEDAVLSHRSAAALLGVGGEMPGRIDVSVPRRCELRRPGLLIRGRPSLGAEDLGFSDGIPVTSPTRTLIDLTTELDLIAVERAVNDADKRDLVDPESLRTALDRYTGEPGVRPLRKLLDKLTFRLSDLGREIGIRHPPHD